MKSLLASLLDEPRARAAFATSLAGELGNRIAEADAAAERAREEATAARRAVEDDSNGKAG